MIAGAWRLRWTLALLPGLVVPALAQGPVPPPLPSLPEAISPELQSCVSRFGHTGCAARLYARMLCASMGSRAGLSTESELEQMQAQLAEQYDQAEIDFRDITAMQVETAAVRYYAPMLCPEMSPRIRELFKPS